MPAISKKTRLIREVARKVAEEMAVQGDPSILQAAEELAGQVRWLGVDGALEVLVCTALHDLHHNGGAKEAEQIYEALDRYDRGEGDE